MNMLATLPPWGIVLIVVAAVVAVFIIALVISLIVRAKKENKEAAEGQAQSSSSSAPAEQPVQDEAKAQAEEPKAAPKKTEKPKAEPAPKAEEPSEPAYAEPVVEKKPASGTKAVSNSAPVAVQEEEPPVQDEEADKEEAMPEDTKPAETTPEARTEKVKPASKTYHVSKRKAENKWQVKMAGGAKAIKMFNTQAEAIDFAKKLAENQEAKIVIHKEDGSFRRLTYHKKK